MRRRATVGRCGGGALVLAVLVSAQALAAQGPASAAEEDGATVVWLVRHAERADDGTEAQPDPSLSEEGRTRAGELARLLSDAGITAVYSTPFQRTRETAAPLAEAVGVEVQTYDPRDQEGMEVFLARIRAPGRHVVVGHSNTTPALVERLGGDALSPIEELEYDRIYVMVLGPDGTVTSSLLRFGAPPPG